MIASSLAGGVVKIPFQFLSKVISDSGKDGPKVVATGCLDLHSETMWKPSSPKDSKAAGKSKTKASSDESGVTRQLTMPLSAPETIYRVTRTRKEGRLKTRRRKVLDAGAENGVVVFTAKTAG